MMSVRMHFSILGELVKDLNLAFKNKDVKIPYSTSQDVSISYPTI